MASKTVSGAAATEAKPFIPQAQASKAGDDTLRRLIPAGKGQPMRKANGARRERVKRNRPAVFQVATNPKREWLRKSTKGATKAMASPETAMAFKGESAHR